jgi:N-acetyl sugar amidotransferase
MKYCQRCVLPDTRPGITLGPDGVCNACKSVGAKGEIDWAGQTKRLHSIFAEARRRSKGFDCLVPVSGGKDSTWQVVICLEQGLRVLAVTWRTPGRTEIGQKNLDNLIRLGVDHIDWSINPEVERKFMRKALVRTGSTGLPMHMAVYTIPLRVAVCFDIPLIVWGENPYMEYGGNDDQIENDRWDHSTALRHAILQGTRPEDWIDEELSRKDLEPYFMPPPEVFENKQIHSLMLGNYLKWDPQESRRVAVAHGFQADPGGPRMGLYDYADIDCRFISVHHHFKWFKFGFTRLWDNLALEIRNGRITRDEAVGIIAGRGDQTPHEDVKAACEFMRMPLEEFSQIEDRFRNPDIWSRDNGRWVIKDFLIKDWNWT